MRRKHAPILRWFYLVACLLSCHVCAHAQEQTQDGFKPLFNGKDLTGWRRVNTDESTWTIRDGMLICSGKPTGELRTKRMYQNFILEVEWRHMKPRGNAGIFVWADDITAPGVPFHRSIEVQVLENAYGNTRGYTTHGDIFPIHGATMEPINGRGGSRAFPTENRSKASPAWNHYRIECRDGEVSLAVNGKVVTRGRECSPRKGYICIESEGGVVHYRNMRIKELPAEKVKQEHVAIAERGFRCLYTGIHLDGWKVAGAWKPQDWRIRYDSEDPGSITTTIDKHDVAFICDVRSEQKSPATIHWRGTPIKIPTSKKWERVEGREEAGSLIVSMGGYELPAIKMETTDDNTLVISTNGPCEFANIYVRAGANKTTSQDSGFRFLATGDMPYTPEQETQFRKLLKQSEAEDFSFLVHVGDFRGGGGKCADAEFQKIRDLFAAYPKPIVYSIGDNEWTDCEVADTSKRAEKVREMFFQDKTTLRLSQLNVTHSGTSHEKFLENYRFVKANVMFCVLHVVGTGNNFDKEDAAKMREFEARNAANLSFLKQAFEEANAKQVAGFALVIHANPSFETGGGAGYKPFLNALRTHLAAFRKPTICLHGDSHYYRIDKPFKAEDKRTIMHFTRMEVFGSPNVAGMSITVDSNDPEVFSAEPYYVRD